MNNPNIIPFMIGFYFISITFLFQKKKWYDKQRLDAGHFWAFKDFKRQASKYADIHKLNLFWRKLTLLRQS